MYTKIASKRTQLDVSATEARKPKDTHSYDADHSEFCLMGLYAVVKLHVLGQTRSLNMPGRWNHTDSSSFGHVPPPWQDLQALLDLCLKVGDDFYPLKAMADL